jgi:uncharacterized membrane protein
MPFCSNCGAEVQGNFCAKCGASVAGGAGTAAPPPPPIPVPAAQVLADNVAAALCYLLGVITGVLFLLLEPYSKNRTVRFHALQSIFLTVAWIAVFIALSIVSMMLLPIPFLGAILSMILHLGAHLGFFILWLMLMYKAYNNERWVLPVIGPLVEKQL